MAETLDAQLHTVAQAMQEGRVIPFMGAGANRCGRSEDESWRFGETTHLPDGRELANDLAEYFGFPATQTRDLVRVSQYASVMKGSGPLYQRLHDVFDADFPPSPLHALLARLPGVWREKRCDPPPYQLIVTTNYDDALERAFADAGEPFDLLSYVAKGPDSGRFLHVPPDGKPRPVKKSNQYPLSLAERTIILKIHGAVNRIDRNEDSYVIAEDDYIDFLSQTSIAKVVPVMLNDHMQNSHFLFLGYSLRDWNLRVILRRIWGEQHLEYRSWSIQRHPDPLELEFWPKRNVDIYDVDLAEYVRKLEGALADLPPCSNGR
jgi:SIR2-like domain